MNDESVIVEVSLPKATLQRLMGPQTCEASDLQVAKREIERLTVALRSARRTAHSYRRDLLYLQEIVSEIGSLVGDTGQDTVLDCVRALRSRYNQNRRDLEQLQLELDDVKSALKAIDEALDDFWRGSTQGVMQGAERVRALARYATARREERDKLTDTLARLVKAMGSRNNGPHTAPQRADESPAMGAAQRLLGELGVAPWVEAHGLMPPSARRSSGPAASRSGAAPAGAPIAAAENGVLRQGIDVEIGSDGRARPISAPDLEQVKRWIVMAKTVKWGQGRIYLNRAEGALNALIEGTADSDEVDL